MTKNQLGLQLITIQVNTLLYKYGLSLALFWRLNEKFEALFRQEQFSSHFRKQACFLVLISIKPESTCSNREVVTKYVRTLSATLALRKRREQLHTFLQYVKILEEFLRTLK